jgi:hypothetical protein
MSVSAVSVHRWTREEYERLAEDGFFGQQGRVELIEGIVYDMSPQKSLHASGVGARRAPLGPEAVRPVLKQYAPS